MRLFLIKKLCRLVELLCGNDIICFIHITKDYGHSHQTSQNTNHSHAEPEQLTFNLGKIKAKA